MTLLGAIGVLEVFGSFAAHFLAGIVSGLSTLTCTVFLGLSYFSKKPMHKRQAEGAFFVLEFIEFVPIIIFCFSQAAQVLGNPVYPHVLRQLASYDSFRRFPIVESSKPCCSNVSACKLRLMQKLHQKPVQGQEAGLGTLGWSRDYCFFILMMSAFFTTSPVELLIACLLVKINIANFQAVGPENVIYFSVSAGETPDNSLVYSELESLK